MGAAEDITGAAAAGFDCFRPEWGRGGPSVTMPRVVSKTISYYCSEPRSEEPGMKAQE